MASYRRVHQKSSPKCKFPRFPNRHWGSGIWFVTVLSFTAVFLVSLGGIIANIVLIINFIKTDNTGFEESKTSDFQLFKNSRFAECSSQVPDAANCSAIRDIISRGPYPLDHDYLDRGYVPISSQWFSSEDGVDYDWCTAASCFKGYTVVPSTARSGVIGSTTFALWTNVNMLTVVYLFVFLKRNWDLYKTRTDKHSHRCERSAGEVGFLNWALLIYTTAGDIIWWWVDYAEFARDPVPNTTLSIYAWAATWLVAANLHYHPYSCILDKSPGLKRTLSWILGILTVVQWGATIHVLAVGQKFTLETLGIYQGYDCAESFVAQAVGTTQCSAQRLCSDAALLGNTPFYWGFEEHMISLGSVAFFVILSVISLQPFVFATWRYMIRDEYSWSEEFKRFDIGPIAGPAIAGIFGAYFTGVAASAGIYLLGHTNREAPIVADPYCQAVHVGLSTWRYYLDLEPNSRALRVAKPFFNA
ncbi:hypothetical protein F4678DRAFT_467435 [Xylaria arbuscula]|nr:hypothetical protein F4678DRAFT_467435 [Xylaria arbuscula]